MRDAFRSRWFRRYDVAIVATMSFLLAMLWVSIAKPLPAMHDEFSYLLAADTFASGRLSNPTPWYWPRLETFHVIENPTRCSKYPPGFAVFLAIGQLIFSPSTGLCLAMAFAGASIYWAARGIFNVSNSALAWMLVMLNPSFAVSWTIQFMPGWPTVGFAALVLGSSLRLRRRMTLGPTSLFAIGVMGLAITRPFEGAAYVSIVAMLFGLLKLQQLRRRAKTVRLAMDSTPVRCFAVGIAILATGMVLMSGYNVATTGKWHRFAYQEHEDQYGLAPLLLFLEPPDETKSYRHEPIRRFHEDLSLSDFKRLQQPGTYLERLGQRLLDFTSTIGLALLAGFGVVWTRQSHLRVPMMLLAVVVAMLLLTCAIPWLMPHYFATLIPALGLIATLTLRQAVGVLPLSGRRFQPVAALILGGYLVSTTAVVFLLQRPTSFSRFAQERTNVSRQLEAVDGLHLACIEYDSNHDPNEEWVYNRADLEAAKVVWVRSTSTSDNLALAEQLDRRCWLIRITGTSAKILPQEISEGDAPTGTK